MVKKKSLKRLVYGLVGIAGVLAVINLFTPVGAFLMGLSDVLLVIGGLNWGVVAISGKGEKDFLDWLFGKLGAK